jgi:hypothetical protein
MELNRTGNLLSRAINQHASGNAGIPPLLPAGYAWPAAPASPA